MIRDRAGNLYDGRSVDRSSIDVVQAIASVATHCALELVSPADVVAFWRVVHKVPAVLGAGMPPAPKLSKFRSVAEAADAFLAAAIAAGVLKEVSA